MMKAGSLALFTLASLVASLGLGPVTAQETPPPPPTPKKIQNLRSEAQTQKPTVPDPASEDDDESESNVKGNVPKAFRSKDAFMDSIRGEVWEKIGTYQVRRVRYDAAGQDVLDYDNRWLHTNPQTDLLDPGIVCVTYKGQSSSWSFFLPDGEHAVTCRTHHWHRFEPHPYEKGTKPWYPDDVWKTDESFDYPFLRLTDGTVELQEKLTDSPTVLHAWQVTNRVSEFTLPDGRVYWAAESADATQLWLIQVQHVFGARLTDGPRVTAVPPDSPEFLDEREKRMLDYVDHLRALKLHAEALTLERELVRRIGRYHGAGSELHQVMMQLLPLAK